MVNVRSVWNIPSVYTQSPKSQEGPPFGHSGTVGPPGPRSLLHLWFWVVFVFLVFFFRFAFKSTSWENAVKAARHLQLKEHVSKDEKKKAKRSCIKLQKRNQFRPLCSLKFDCDFITCSPFNSFVIQWWRDLSFGGLVFCFCFFSSKLLVSTNRPICWATKVFSIFCVLVWNCQRSQVFFFFLLYCLNMRINLFFPLQPSFSCLSLSDKLLCFPRVSKYLNPIKTIKFFLLMTTLLLKANHKEEI